MRSAITGSLASRFLVVMVGVSALTHARPSPASAQEGNLVDRIVAVVGDSAITLTQVQERLFQLRARGMEIPTDPQALEDLQSEMLENIIGEKLIVQAALEDSTIVVEESELDEIVNQDIQQRTSQFGGTGALQDALAEQGWTLASYREFLRGQARQQRLYNQYLAKRSGELSNIEVTEEEIREFFEEQRGAMGERPPTVSFVQIILETDVSGSTVDSVRAEAERIREMAQEGEDFGELARRFSDDPGTRESGGELGWFRRGEMVPAFEEMAFRLGPDQISPPVQTPFGFHLIKVERRRAGEVRARHILLRIPASESDVVSGQERAQEVKEGLEAGEDFQTLREEYGLLDAPDSLNVPFDRLRELPPGFAEPLLQADAGDVLGPIRYEAQGSTRFGVLKVEDVREGGTFQLEDVRSQIQEQLRQEKLMEEIVAELTNEMFVEVRS